MLMSTWAVEIGLQRERMAECRLGLVGTAEQSERRRHQPPGAGRIGFAMTPEAAEGLARMALMLLARTIS
jgi:hypothetical protein